MTQIGILVLLANFGAAEIADSDKEKLAKAKAELARTAKELDRVKKELDDLRQWAKTAEMKVTLPNSKDIPRAKSDRLIVEIAHDGGFSSKGKKLKATQLLNLIRLTIVRYPHGTALIRADRNAPWMQVIRVMAMCNRSKMRYGISLAIEK